MQVEFPADSVQAARLRLRVCEASASEQRDLRKAFGESCELWLNMTGWTYRVKEVAPDGSEVPVPADRALVPFVTWRAQTHALRDVLECVRRGENWVCNKSREQGATWLLFCAVALWGWLFHGWKSLVCSKDEKAVDLRGDSDCIFWKLDKLLELQPAWLLPAPFEAFEIGGKLRTHMMLRNPKGGAAITGQASGASIGIGGRQTLLVFDEAARQQHFREAWRGAQASAACCGVISTHFGAGTMYEELVSKARVGAGLKLIELLYHDHPEQGRGKEERIDHDGSITSIRGQAYWWSPWLEKKARKLDQIGMAQDVFARAVGSGASFFPSIAVSGHRNRWAREPERCVFTGREMTPSDSGSWWIFERPDRDRLSRTGGWAVGIDPAYGTGNHNSVAAVLDTARGYPTLVAMYVSPVCSPADLAAELAMVGRTMYRDALMAWEINGPGQSLARDFEAQRYAHLWRQRAEGVVHDEMGTKFGWWSSEQSKRQLLGELSRAVQQGELRVLCGTTLEEMLAYQLDETGKVVPGRLRDEPSGARENHGDRVVALALAWIAAADAAPLSQPVIEYPRGSLGADPDAFRLLHPELAREDPFDLGGGRHVH